jgi:hypothetical protein
MASKTFSCGVLSIFCLFLVQSAVPQLILDLSDEQNVSLAIDYLRKGVQQEDIEKILKVCGPTVTAGGKQILSKEEIGRQFGAVFDGSSARKTVLARPSFNRADNPLTDSHFWDFDILEPKINISGDTAIVDCEFVLWADAGVEGKPGRRVHRQLIFALSKPAYRPIPDDSGYIPNLFRPEGEKSGIFRDWRLVDLGGLLGFIGDSAQKAR